MLQTLIDYYLRKNKRLRMRLDSEKCGTVDAYKLRRAIRINQKRLQVMQSECLPCDAKKAYNDFAKLDASDDINWVTINGSHVPLNEGGEVIGGALKGKGFSDAKSTKKSQPSQSKQNLQTAASKKPIDWKTKLKGRAAEKLLNECGGEWKSGLSDIEKKTLRSYTTVGFTGINRALRGNGEQSPDMQEKIECIDSAIDKFDLKENITVWRGLSEKNLDLSSGMVGTVIKDNAFMSTTVAQGTAEEFAINSAGESDTPVLLKLDIPKGIGNGAYMNGVSIFNEKEFLVKRGASFEIYKDTKVRVSSNKAKNEELEYIRVLQGRWVE